MKIQKRGISDIITTVLIILLAIAAVVLIWGFIKSPIEQGGKQIQASGDCFSLKLKPTGCIINAAKTNLSATVQWAEGNVALKTMKFVVTDGTGATQVLDVPADTLTILQTKSVVINTTSLNVSSGLTLSATGVIQPKNSAESVPCTTSQTETLVCS